MKLSDQIKSLRKKKGITQEELADTINVSRSVIAKYETGRAIPNEENLNLLSKELGVTLVVPKETNKESLQESGKRFLLYFSFVLSITGILSFFLPIFIYYVKEIVNGEVVAKLPEYRSMLYVSITNHLVVPWIFLIFSIILLTLCILKLFPLKHRSGYLIPIIAFLMVGEIVLLFLPIYFIIGTSIYI